MRYYVRQSEQDRIEGPYGIDEIKRMTASGSVSTTAQVVEARGQTSFQLKSENWISTKAVLTDLAEADQQTPNLFSSPVSTDNSMTSSSKRVMTRYRDAYLVATATVSAGGIIKGLGVFLAVLIFVCAILASDQTNVSGDLKLAGIIFGMVVAIVVGGAFYLLGIHISAQGQILQASLDTAVNGSPFLTNDQRAQIMSIR